MRTVTKVARPLTLALMLMALAVGCTVVRGTISTYQALSAAGYTNPQVSTDGDLVTVHVGREAEDMNAAARTAAEIVWRNLPVPIDQLEVVCENRVGTTGRYSASRLELVAAFGERDPALNSPVKEGELRRLGLIAIAVVIGGLVMLVAIVVGIVLLVRKSKRQQQEQPPGPPPWSHSAPPPPYHPPS